MNFQAESAREAVMEAVLNLAKTCQEELPHARHVTGLALKLFDQLLPLHQLGQNERDWLEYAGLLHDIGWVEGGIQHHKTSLHIILNTAMLPFDGKQRLIIGSIARYHRKAEPSEKHDHFATLDPEEQAKVVILSAILRLADSLDRTHQSLVRDVACRIQKKTILVTCLVKSKPKEEIIAVKEKGSLLEQVFKRSIKIKWKLPKSS